VIDAHAFPAVAICPDCGHRHHFKQMLIFFIKGASGTGKSTLCQTLTSDLTGVAVLESDILWRNEFDTPENDYRPYRELWLRLSKNISQAGVPVMLCGCLVPNQIETCIERRYFASTYYLALVCSPAELEKRLRARPAWRSVDEQLITDHLAYNDWICANAGTTHPPMDVLETTGKTVTECSAAVKDWLQSRWPASELEQPSSGV
jgi:broad-specificity NMP kinase